jgi:hypothetical protein
MTGENIAMGVIDWPWLIQFSGRIVNLARPLLHLLQ